MGGVRRTIIRGPWYRANRWDTLRFVGAWLRGDRCAACGTTLITDYWGPSWTNAPWEDDRTPVAWGCPDCKARINNIEVVSRTTRLGRTVCVRKGVSRA